MKHFSRSVILLTIFWATAAMGMTKVGEIAIPENAEEVVVAGDYLYVAFFDSGMYIYDISEPASPAFAGKYEPPEGSADRIDISGSYAYVTTGEQLDIVDISSPAAPTRAGSVQLACGEYYVKVSGTYAFLASSCGLEVADVSNPEEATVVGSYFMKADTTGYEPCTGFDISDDYAFIAFEDTGLIIVTIEDPQSPSYTGRYTEEDGMRIWSVAQTGTHVCLAAYDEGLKVVDVSDPENPALSGGYDVPSNLENDSWDVEVSGNTAFILYQAGGVYAVDIGNPEQPAKTAQYPSGISVGGDYRYMDVGGNYVYAYHEDQQKVLVIDASDVLAVRNPFASNNKGGISPALTITGGSSAINIRVDASAFSTSRTLKLGLFSATGRRMASTTVFPDGRREWITWSQPVAAGIYIVTASFDGRMLRNRCVIR